VIVITKRDICIYATIKGAETIKATQSRLLGVKIAQFQSGAPKLACYQMHVYPKITFSLL